MKMPTILAALTAALSAGLWAQESDPTSAPASRPTTRFAVPQPRIFEGLDLSDEQQKRMTDLAEARNRAVQEWQRSSQSKIAAAQADLAAARKSKDEPAAKGAQDHIQAVYNELVDIEKKAQADMLGVLTPAQRDRWQENRIVNMIASRFYATRLTDPQLAQVRKLYADSFRGVDLDNAQAVYDALERLTAAVQEKVLSDGQRRAVGQAAASAPSSRPTGLPTPAPLRYGPTTE